MTQLKQIGEARLVGAEPAAGQPTHQEDGGKALGLLLLALKALSQRTAVALVNSVTLIGLGSAFWLWLLVLPDPTVLKLVGLGLYGAFIIALRFVWR